MSDLPVNFEYRLIDVQYDLNYIDIVGYINLSKVNEKLLGVEDFYYQASIEILTYRGPPAEYAAKHDAAIVYGITVPCNAENEGLAAEFIELLLLMKVENGQPLLDPSLCDHAENLPVLLKPLFD